MGFLENDQDYLDAGVAPPEHNLTQLPGDDNDALGSIINASGQHKHEWKQYGIGGDVECTGGPNPHGFRSKPNQLLIRTANSGGPIFKTLDI